MLKIPSKFVLPIFALVGCVMAQSGIAAEEPALGTVVAETEMQMFCQNAAAAKYEVDLMAIGTNPPIRREGKFLVLGTVQGEDRASGFDCRFEADGAYIGIIGDPAMDQ